MSYDESRATVTSDSRSLREQVAEAELGYPRGPTASFVGSLYPYQLELFQKARKENVVIHLPTGGGKTVIAAALAAAALDECNFDRCVVMLVNRVPLVRQQQEVLRRHIPKARVAGIAGEKKDTASWADARRMLQDGRHSFDIIVIIDSIFYLWTLTNATMWDDIELLIIDEVHHARKNSFFAKIAKQYSSIDLTSRSSRLRVAGLTASPGADISEIKTKQNIIELLQLTGCHIAAVIDEVDDLKRRVRVPSCCLIEFELERVEFIVEITIVETIRAIERRVAKGFDVNHEFANAFTCVGMPMGSMQYVVRCAEIAAQGRGHGDIALMHTALALKKLNEALILLGEVGVHAVTSFLLEDVGYVDWVFKQLDSQDRHQRNIHRLLGEVLCPFFYGVYVSEGEWKHKSSSMSTKMKILVDVIKRISDSLVGQSSETVDDFRGIVFCQTKRGADQIVKYLKGTPVARLNPCLFVGHSRTLVDDTEGNGSSVTRVISMTDTQQQSRLAEFRRGDVKLLVATSVAEEGLDIPNCNVIIRFDGELTVKSFIQTRGRARKENSKYFALMRHGNEATSFQLACAAVATQERVVRQICMQRAGQLPGVMGTKLVPRWSLEPLLVLTTLTATQQYEAQISQAIMSAGAQGKTVVMDARVRLPQLRALFRIVTRGVGHENQARKIAAWWICRIMVEALGIDLDAVMDHQTGNVIQTVQVHNTKPVASGTVVASLRVSAGVQSADAEVVTTYRAEDWQGVHPFQVLQKELSNGRTPDVSHAIVDGTYNVKMTLLNTITRQMFTEEAAGSTYVEALGTAALRALQKIGKPQVRKRRQEQYWT